MRQRTLLFSPSILGSNFKSFEKATEIIASSGADYMHLDVMDGNFVPDITFGKKVIHDLRPITDLVFDVHLMVEKPERHIEEFAKAGSGIIAVHPEATNHIWRCLKLIKDCGCECSVAINPGTSVSSIESVLELCDYVIVMTVNPGWGGQSFLHECVKKIEELDLRRESEGYKYLIECDGGISGQTIAECYRAGMDIAVIGSAFFASADKKAFLTEMTNIAEGVI